MQHRQVWRLVMRTRGVTEPHFAAETTALLARLGPASPISDYAALLADCGEPVDRPWQAILIRPCGSRICTSRPGMARSARVGVQITTFQENTLRVLSRLGAFR